jgi:hypothetical protein
VLPHVVGISWVVGAAILTLAPALHHGLSLGPYDILSQSGLTRVSGVTVRNTVSADQIDEMIPWSTLAWTQVHQGHIPLWNPFNGLGLPLAFNWQSAAFSLPALISYLFPLHLAYTAQIIATLVIAGTGAYALARVLRLGVIGCATAGTVYELSGSFMGWLGWPHAAVMSWAGWIFAVAILIFRGQHRARNIVAVALIFALAVFAGEPEIFVILVASLAVFVLTMVIIKFMAAHSVRHSMRPLMDLSIASVAGAALSAPLALPGLQVLAGSTRNSGTLLATTEVGKALPPHDLVHLLVQGYNGLPIAGSQMFGDAVYTDTAAYVGLIGVALAVLGVVRGWRQPETVSFVVLTVATLAIVYAPPIQALFIHIPLVQTIDWHRDLMTVGLCFGILAGVGMDALVKAGRTKTVQLVLASVLTVGLVLLLVLWLVSTSGLSPLDARLRQDSLELPLVTAGLALIAVAVLAGWASKGRAQPPSGLDERTQQPIISPNGDMTNAGVMRWLRSPTFSQVIGLLLLLLETAFLVVSGAQLWSSSTQGATPTSAVASLVRIVGGSTVGSGDPTCYAGPGLTNLGVLPESNILFGLHEFDFYDPILPREYLKSWSETSGTNPGVLIYNSFCPAITKASQARLYGVKYVLEPVGAVGPTGSIFDREIGNEDLFRIPNSGDATLTSVALAGHLPPVDAPGTPISVDHPSPSSLRITTTSRTDQILRLRLTNEPGWHATINGHPLKLVPFAGVMLEARIPAGHHVIELDYWPTLFTVGLLVAGSCALVILSAFVALIVRRRFRLGRTEQQRGSRPAQTLGRG